MLSTPRTHTTDVASKELFVTVIDDPTDGTSLTRTVEADERLGTTLVMLLAEARGEEPADLSPPLHDFVDAEALEALFSRRGEMNRSGVEVRLELYGWTVLIETKDPRPGPDELR